LVALPHDATFTWKPESNYISEELANLDFEKETTNSMPQQMFAAHSGMFLYNEVEGALLCAKEYSTIEQDDCHDLSQLLSDNTRQSDLLLWFGRTTYPTVPRLMHR
jgi:hypothetical protein